MFCGCFSLLFQRPYSKKHLALLSTVGRCVFDRPVSGWAFSPDRRDFLGSGFATTEKKKPGKIEEAIIGQM